MVFGTFDLLHPGHLFVLREAKKRGRVSVIVARDENVVKIKGARPVESELVRKKAIEDSFPYFSVRLGDVSDFLVPVRETKPDLILLGYDQRLPPKVQESDFSCAVERLPSFKPEIHKSSLKKRGRG